MDRIKRYFIIFFGVCFFSNQLTGYTQLKEIKRIPLPESLFYAFVQPVENKLYLVLDTGLGIECREISDTTAKLIWRRAGVKLRTSSTVKRNFIIAIDFFEGKNSVTFFLIDIYSGEILDQTTYKLNENTKYIVNSSSFDNYFLFNFFIENATTKIAQKKYMLLKVVDDNLILKDQFVFELTINRFFIQNDILYGSNYASCNSVKPENGLSDCSLYFFAYSLVNHRILNHFAIPEMHYGAIVPIFHQPFVYLRYSSNSYAFIEYSGLVALLFPSLKLIKDEKVDFTFTSFSEVLQYNGDLLFPLLDNTGKTLYFFNTDLKQVKKIEFSSKTRQKFPIVLKDYKIVKTYSYSIDDLDQDSKQEILVYSKKLKLPLDPRAVIIPDEDGIVRHLLEFYFIDDDLEQVIKLTPQIKLEGQKAQIVFFNNQILLLGSRSLTWFNLE